MSENITDKSPSRCPACDGKAVVPILYGLPRFDAALRDDLKYRRVFLGGCIVEGDEPLWRCSTCDELIFQNDKDKQSYLSRKREDEIAYRSAVKRQMLRRAFSIGSFALAFIVMLGFMMVN